MITVRNPHMCLILFAWQCRADLPLVLLANRDELLDRPTAPAGPWPDRPEVVAGRDLVAGGSWFGAGRDGRWAAVTNIREGERTPHGSPSRGWLVRDYLLGGASPEAFYKRYAPFAGYAGCNLLLGNCSVIWYISNRETAPLRLPPGYYGLSNGRLDTPWPKVVQGKAAFAGLLQAGALSLAAGFRLLADPSLAPDHELPATGVPLAWERALSATFIVAPERNYGTRSSTLLLRGADGSTLLVERSFAGSPACWSQRSYQWQTAG
jgi:uncharacterized protein with NRDE domain